MKPEIKTETVPKFSIRPINLSYNSLEYLESYISKNDLTNKDFFTIDQFAYLAEQLIKSENGNTFGISKDSLNVFIINTDEDCLVIKTIFWRNGAVSFGFLEESELPSHVNLRFYMKI